MGSHVSDGASRASGKFKCRKCLKLMTKEQFDNTDCGDMQ